MESWAVHMRERFERDKKKFVDDRKEVYSRLDEFKKDTR